MIKMIGLLLNDDWNDWFVTKWWLKWLVCYSMMIEMIGLLLSDDWNDWFVIQWRLILLVCY